VLRSVVRLAGLFDVAGGVDVAPRRQTFSDLKHDRNNVRTAAKHPVLSVLHRVLDQRAPVAATGPRTPAGPGMTTGPRTPTHGGARCDGF